MDPKILDVRLVPSWDSPAIKRLLLRSLGSAELLQAAIAYWTVSDDIFGSHLVRVLQHKDALLCVDLHQPTDLDSLASLARKGCHVYLYCEDITARLRIFVDRGTRLSERVAAGRSVDRIPLDQLGTICPDVIMKLPNDGLLGFVFPMHSSVHPDLCELLAENGADFRSHLLCQAGLLYIVPKGIVDQRLVVAAMSLTNLVAKVIYDITIQPNRDSNLLWRQRDHGSAFALAEVVLALHIRLSWY
jgi:hypothetical protein